MKSNAQGFAAFWLATSSFLALAHPAFAQSTAAAADAGRDEADVIVVTGSNIRMRESSARAPIQVVDRAEIEGIAASQASKLFKLIPSNSGSEAYTEAQARAGVSQFNLRGLGYASTLTLLNGRRAGVSPLTDESGAEFVDVNQFPLAMIGRVEVLKDGASAIYGSDAVAGVVNLITRTGYEGFELSGGYFDASNHGWDVNLVMGKRFDGGSFNVYATHYEQSGNVRTDFDWLVARVHGNGQLGRSQLLTSNGAPSTYRPGGLNANGDPIGLAGGVGFADPDCEAAGGVFRITDAGAVDRSQCLHNFADQVGMIPSTDRWQAFAELNYEISPQITYAGEISYSRNIQTTVRGPGGYSNGSVADRNPGNIYIPADHPFNFFVRDPGNPNRLVYIEPEAWNSSIHEAVDVVSSSRVFGVPYNGFAGGGERRSQSNYFRILNEVSYDLAPGWRASAYHQFAAVDFIEHEDYRYNADALNAAIIDGRLNPFGTAIVSPDLVSPKDGVSRAGNSLAIQEEVLATSNFIARSSQHVIEANVSGPLFSLRDSPVSAAVGVQYRRVTIEETPDALQAAGEGDNANVQYPIYGEQDVFAAYGEATWAIDGRADLQLAVRFEDYGGDTGSSVNPKVAGRFALNDAVTLRGSIGTSFQGPTIRQTSETLTRQFLNVPYAEQGGHLVCSATTDSGNFLIRTSGGDGLDPQSSTNYNLGIILSPARGLTASVDYWNYRYKDLIAAGVNAQAIVDNDCADDGVPNDPRVIVSGGLITEIQTDFVNVGRVNADGLDIAGGYSFDIENTTVQLAADATYLNKFDVIDASGDAYDGAGSRNFANNFRTMPKWRGSGSVGVQHGPFGALASVRYIDGYANDQSNDAPIKSWTSVDVAVTMALPLFDQNKPMVLTVGADNVFDADPPALRRYTASGEFVTGTINDIDRPAYDAYSGVDIRGREIFVRLKKEL